MTPTLIRKIIFAVLLVSCCAMGVWNIFLMNIHSPAIVASNGEMRLDSPDFSFGSVICTGQWRKYEGLYTPDQLNNQKYTLTENFALETQMPNHTYSVTLIAQEDNWLRMMFPKAEGCKAWINGMELYAADGSLKASDIFALQDYRAEDGRYHIVLQVAPSTSSKGNYQGPILGTEAALKHIQIIWVVLNAVAVGIYVFLIINCLSLFFQKRTERYLIILCLLVIQTCIRSISIAKYPLIYLFVPISTPAVILIDTITKHPLPLRFELLKIMVPGIVPRWMTRLVYGLFFLSLPIYILGNASLVGNLLLSVEMIFLAIEGGIIMRGYFQSRRNCTVMMVGFWIYMSLRIFGRLLFLKIVPAGVTDIVYYPWQYGHLAYIAAYAVAINGIFAHKFHEADALSVRLEKINSELEPIVAEKTRELKDSNEKLQQALEALMQAQTRKREFMSNLIHNLRSPIFSLSGQLEILSAQARQGIYNPQKVEHLQQKTDHLKRMVDHLFLMTKLDDHSIDFHMMRFDLDALLRQIAEDFQSRSLQKHITVRYESSQSPYYICSDSYYLQQALENIMDNAVRHVCECGEILISLQSGEEGWTEIFVQNEGDQITPKDLPHIFERYYKGAQHTSSQTGLGLAIVMEIVQQHGGMVNVVSNVDVTRFIIRIPDGNE